MFRNLLIFYYVRILWHEQEVYRMVKDIYFHIFQELYIIYSLDFKVLWIE